MFNTASNHSKITIDGMTCLRAEYYHNTCSLCIDICPEEAITMANNKRVALDTRRCIDCSGCIGVCPTSAISHVEFDPNRFIVSFSGGDEMRLSCKSNTPCLNIFNAEQFLSLGLRNDAIVCDMSHCEECKVNKNGIVESSIKRHIEEANRFIEAMGTGKQIVLDYEAASQLERRVLFRKLAKGAKGFQSDIDIGGIFKENDTLPVHRQLLQHSLKGVIEKIDQTTILQAFSFTANKQIDFQSCTNCGDCVQFCPTDALIYSSDKSRILFQNLRCIACGICDDICKPNSFSDKQELDLIAMTFGRAMIAIEHHFTICSECKTAFPQKNSETLCARCVDFVGRSGDLFTLARDL